jgi:alpha-tubulin suppressor-like RCC1 family protein
VCAVLNNDRLKCWGGNAQGQLGLAGTTSRGNTAGSMGAALPFVDLGPVSTVVSVAAGDAHTCAVLTDGVLKCFGA